MPPPIPKKRKQADLPDNVATLSTIRSQPKKRKARHESNLPNNVSTLASLRSPTPELQKAPDEDLSYEPSVGEESDHISEADLDHVSEADPSESEHDDDEEGQRGKKVDVDVSMIDKGPEDNRTEHFDKDGKIVRGSVNTEVTGAGRKKYEKKCDEGIRRTGKDFKRSWSARNKHTAYNAKYGYDVRDDQIEEKDLLPADSGGFYTLVPDDDGEVEAVGGGLYRDLLTNKVLQKCTPGPMTKHENKDREKKGLTLMQAAKSIESTSKQSKAEEKIEKWEQQMETKNKKKQKKNEGD